MDRYSLSLQEGKFNDMLFGSSTVFGHLACRAVSANAVIFVGQKLICCDCGNHAAFGFG